MSRLPSKAIAVLGVAALILAACGSSTPQAADPVGGVAAAFATAKSGGILKQFDLVACLSSGGALGSSFSGLFGGLTGDAMAAAGISADDLSGAWKLSFDDIKTSQTSLSGDTAVVHVTVKVTSEVDAGKLRELVKKYGATQGIVPDDATIDAAIQAKLGGQLKMSETIDKDISVVKQNGLWVACGSPFGTAAGGTPTAGTTPVPSLAPAITVAPTSDPGTAAASGGPSASGDVVAITAGSAHNCALLSNGGVKCWGVNSSGQLGNGTTGSASATAQYVTGLSSGIEAISSWAGTYTCALTTSSGVKCWGTGAVGNGSKTATTTPQDVVGLTSGVDSISAGFDHACAVTVGTVKCWGNNSDGQLGDGSTTSSSVPIKVAGLSGVAAVSSGQAYTCAVLNAGGVKCWGRNSAGELGNGSTTGSKVPVDVAGLSSGVRAAAAGAGYTCALLNAGSVKCWGGGSAIPVDIAGIDGGAAAIFSPLQIACAAISGGGLKCWTAQEPTAKSDPAVPANAIALAYGGQATFCLLLESGGVVCAAGNSIVSIDGLDAGSGSTSGPATASSGNSTAIAIGFQHTCVVSAAGGIRCWGQNGDGQLGTGSTGSSASPVDVFGLSSGVIAIDAGFGYSCAVTSAGAVKCWGRNNAGQLGSGATANSLIPIDVIGLTSGTTAITLSFSHACALSSAGAVKCWGENSSYQLGTGTQTSSLVPVAISSLSSSVKAIDARENMTCAVTRAGGVKCWGTGMTGNGLAGNLSLRNVAPVDVVGLTSGATAVAVGSQHVCVLMSTGGVKCWGANSNGELGTGSIETVFPYVPVAVKGLGGVIAIDAGTTHTCVLTSGGGVKCWGANGAGQLGNGTTVNSTTPTDVAGLSSGVKAIRAGDTSNCAIMNTGAVKCWGGDFGTSPIDIAGL